MKKVGYFLREVAQLVVNAEPHSAGADHLLPPQRTPSAVVTPTTSQIVCDLTPPLRTGPDIAADAQTAALILLTSLLAQVRPSPIRSQGDHLLNPRCTGLVLPVVVLEPLISIVDPRCQDGASVFYYESLLHIVLF